MAKMSLYLFAAGFIALGLATVFYLWYLLRRPEGRGKVATVFAWLGVVFLGLSLGLRWIVAGRAPYANMYEFSVSFAWGIALSYVVAEHRFHQRSVGVFVLPWALALLAYAATLPSAITPLVPALQNQLLLTLHVAFAVVSYGAFAVACGTAVMFLLQGPQGRFSWMPAAAVLDDMSYKLVIVGFPLFALVLLLGAYWGNIAWGRYWGWDPKETASLVTWLIYAAYLHARNLRGWRGKPSAVLLIAGFGATLFTYFGVNLVLPGLHSYAGL